MPETISVSSALGPVRAAGGAAAANVCARALVGCREVARVHAHVELREVEAEELDAAAQRGEAAVGDPRAAVRAQAAVDHVEVGEQSSPSVAAASAVASPSRCQTNESLRRYGSSAFCAPIAAA